MLALTAVAGVALALIAAYEFAVVLGGSSSRHEVGAFLLALGALMGLAIAGYLAVHHEHQLRSVPSQAPAHISILPWRGGSHRYGPVSAMVVAGAFVIGTIVAFVSIFITYSHGARSHLTQTQGIPSSAAVTSVTHVRHSSKSGTWYSANISVTLADRQTSVVHDPHDVNLDFGQVVQVLTDPKDSSYSEFPGEPATWRYEWLLVLAVTLFIGGVATKTVMATLGMRRTRQPSVTWTDIDKSAPAPASDAQAQSPSA